MTADQVIDWIIGAVKVIGCIVVAGIFLTGLGEVGQQWGCIDVCDPRFEYVGPDGNTVCLE